MRTLGVGLLLLVGCSGSGEKCSDQTFGAPFCVPDAGVAPVGQALQLEVVDVCHGGCGTAHLACVVSRDGGTLALELAGEVCEAPPGRACALLCALSRLPCAVPALEEGDYQVTSRDQPTQTLHVRDAGVATCSAMSF